ncbi:MULTISPECIES: hypothetical protein [unclassified Blastococcus]
MTASTDPAAAGRDVPAGAPLSEVPPGSRFRRIGGALSLVASGTLVCLSLVMIPYDSQTDEAYLRTGVEHTANVLWAAVVLHYGYLLLLPAALTLVRLARRRVPRTALAAMVVAGLGAGLSGIVAVDFYAVAAAEELPTEAALRVLQAADGYGQVALITLPAVLGVVLGTNLAVFAAWRARAIPFAPVALGLVGWVVFVFFAGDAWLPSLSTALIAVSLAWCGVIVLRMRDEAWARA